MLSVIIPIKNEPLIAELVRDIDSDITEPHETIIVDESSEPLGPVKGATVKRQVSSGLGNAFLEGLSAAKGDIIALMDGDFSHDPKDLALMVRRIGNADLVVGSKRLPGAKTNDDFSRDIVSVATSRFLRLFLGLPVKDATSGFLVAKRSVIESLTLRPRGYKIVAEILYKSKKNGAVVEEFPIIFRKRRAGRSKVGFGLCGIRELLNLVVFAAELRLGIR
jgi:glycosyltransferase involved in cell wall biosynthesis